MVVSAIAQSPAGGVSQEKILGQRFRLCGGFFENVSWHFSHGDVKFEHRDLRASPPTINLPMSPHEFDFRMRREIEQQRMLSAIKLLRKHHDWFGTPGSAIDRPKDAY